MKFAFESFVGYNTNLMAPVEFAMYTGDRDRKPQVEVLGDTDRKMPFIKKVGSAVEFTTKQVEDGTQISVSLNGVSTPAFEGSVPAEFPLVIKGKTVNFEVIKIEES